VSGARGGPFFDYRFASRWSTFSLPFTAIGWC